MNSLAGMGKIIIMIGIFMVITGGLLLLAGKIPGLGRLPGDIFVQRGNFTFYFPVVTMIIVSIVLTLLVNLLFRR
ncbi:DUF2905 domain-containing protein [Desulfallas thermosapovorans]|uniref:DUF2905 family protein n=1 Tax=Desulfallas thermosapovorans DSM 6562 TaxID=1121431 RepID=A0A5S4ZY49_9FIRM|nr:DUF2905 domain-containing protein [Desulfallas thermosapovorans]TYO97942.1 Protein of unknown function (DUF2905) [Desulfallas thermosapovorans DSM 6562]